METLFEILMVAAFVVLMYFLLFRHYRKDAIVLELDDRYITQEDKIQAVLDYYSKKEKSCERIDSYHIILEGTRYKVSDRNINYGVVPVQQLVLEKEK